MIGTAIKFETFAIDASGRHGVARHTSEDVSRARDDGFCAGHQAGRDAEVAAMAQAMNALARSLAEDADRAAACRAETLAALAPVLGAIVETFAEAGPARRLRETLQHELSRLAARAQAGRIAVAGPASLRVMVEEMAPRAGLDRIDFTAVPEATGITITPGPGRMDFSQDQAVAEIRRLIAELQEDAQ